MPIRGLVTDACPACLRIPTPFPQPCYSSVRRRITPNSIQGKSFQSISNSSPREAESSRPLHVRLALSAFAHALYRTGHDFQGIKVNVPSNHCCNNQTDTQVQVRKHAFQPISSRLSGLSPIKRLKMAFSSLRASKDPSHTPQNPPVSVVSRKYPEVTHRSCILNTASPIQPAFSCFNAALNPALRVLCSESLLVPSRSRRCCGLTLQERLHLATSLIT
jgi:hypothetical protein